MEELFEVGIKGIVEFDNYPNGKVTLENNAIIIINEDNCKGLFHNDKIITKEDGLQVIERNIPFITGVLELTSKIRYGYTKKGNHIINFKPLDFKHYPNFKVSTSLLRKKSISITNKYCIVSFVKFDDKSIIPFGNIIEILGNINDSSCYYKLVKYIHNIPMYKNPYKKFHPELPSPKPEQYKKRPFFEAFSIDPEGCSDIDDCVSCNKVDGNYIVGVHITDIWEYLTPETFVNASKQLSSIYNPDGSKYNMLPDILADDICSLHENTVKPCLSVVLTFNNDKQFVSYNIIETYVKNTAKYTYNQVDKVFLTDEYFITLCHLLSNLVGNTIYDSHKLIEYLMIIANKFVGKWLTGKNIKHPIRIQPISKSNYDHVPKDIAILMKTFNNEKAYYVDNNLETDDVYHHSLDVKDYTHFTSPIRRFVDIITHKLIKETLHNNKIMEYNYSDILVNINMFENILKRYYSDCNKITILFHVEKSGKTMVECVLINIDNNYGTIYIKEFDIYTKTKLYDIKMQALSGDMFNDKLYKTFTTQIHINHNEINPFRKLRFVINN